MNIDELFSRGKERGIEDMEIYVIKNSSTKFKIYQGELENYNISKEGALSLRGIYKGKMGYSYTEKLTEDSIDELIDNLIQYAQCNEKEYIEKLSSPKEITIKNKENKLSEYGENEKINFLKSIEEKAYSADKRVKLVETCNYEEYDNTIFIKNTKGLELKDKYSVGIVALSLVTKDDKDTQIGYSYRIIDDLLEKHKDILIKEAVDDGINMLGASTIPSGNYEIILRNNVAADLFSTMAPVFLADMVQRNLSLMRGKIGEKVASELLNIVDNPLLENGSTCRNFDDEGTPTFAKHIIEKGILKTFLHNNRTAEKEGVKSTGNGFRTSHKSSLGVLPTNIYIEEGEDSLEDMVKSVNEGILITDIQGLHAGINTTSGDFSLSSNGYLIENGKIIKPVNQIVIAGNFYKMLKGIKALGKDTSFSFPGTNYFGSPSIRINSLTVAGN